jgi:3-isopropylmalate dehydrogenase
MDTYRIAAIDGDGIGPEVMGQARKALAAAGHRFHFDLEYTHFDLGGQRYLTTGEVLPDEELALIRNHDAILLGAVGTPDVPPGVLERGLLLRIRFEFDQYVNLRPVKLYEGVPTPIAGLTPDRCNFLVIRENTEGSYVGTGGFFRKGTPYEIATQNSINTRHGVERVILNAFGRAAKRNNKLTVAHKTNVMAFAGDLWWRTARELAPQFPHVELEYVHADALCLHMINTPERYDVIVTDNLFGDIVTDLGAAIQGGLGMAASGNINPAHGTPSMFEPVHGSAPDIAGNGWANPVAAVLSAAMCMDDLGEPEAAIALEAAATSVLPELKSMGGPDMGMSTDQIGDLIAGRVAG